MSGLRTFGHFRFDPRTLELRAGGARVPLEPMPARILARLLETPGEMVSREELLELGWPKLPQVADPSLNTCVRQIRAALDDDAREPRFVETLRGRGYRFAAPVATTELPRRAVSAGPAPSHGLRWAGPAIAAAAAVILVLVTSPTGAPRIPERVESELTKAELVFDRYQDADRALAIVDTLATTHAGVARVHTLRAELLLMLGRHDESGRAVDIGLALDRRDAVGQRVRAAREMFASRWSEAEAALARSIAGDADDAATWVAKAYLETVRGRFIDAERSIARALAIDPLSPTVQGDVGLLHMWAGRYDEAVDSCREVVALTDQPPAWSIECAFDALVLAGRVDEATTWAAPLLVEARLVPADAVPDEAHSSPDEVVRALRMARADVVLRWRESGGPVTPYVVALASARAGDVKTALDALEDAAREPGFGVLSAAVDPRFTLLHDEPRFRALVSRLRLAG